MKDKKQTVKEKLPVQATKMVDLISYQRGSVVSRTIIDRKAGTVTLFAFDEGEGLSEHTAPYDALVFVVDGEADVTVSGNRIRVKEGEAVLIPANKPHALSAMKMFKIVLTMIRS